MINHKIISLTTDLISPISPIPQSKNRHLTKISGKIETKHDNLTQDSMSGPFIPKINRNYADIPTNNVALAPLIGISSSHFGTITTTYNTELTHFQKQFSTMDKMVGNRQTGVSRAWKYEYAEVKMGGKGTGHFNSQQRQELLDTNRVRGAEGHHINNVADHPELQADPNNIKMTANREAHLREHHGDFKNETSGPLLDRDGRLVNVNRNRVIRNELSGIGLAAAIGLCTGFTIGFVVELARNGLNPDNVKNAFVSGSNAAGENAVLAIGSALIGRTLGTVASTSLNDIVLSHIGNNLAEQTLQNISKICSLAAVGSLTIIALSVYQFVKLKQAGYSSKECLLRTGKSAALSASVLVLSIIAQGIWGGPAGIVVSLIAGVIITGNMVIGIICDKKVAQEIALYTISLCRPSYV